MEGFKTNIYSWYSLFKRDLPWRRTDDPYKIWLSEIILQQTRVNQGQEYYLRFIENYPTLSDLAMASEDEILKLWQGLGYYSRARHLHYTARYITEHYNGVFPSDYDSILKLKGVGTYTAAAIASIAYHLPYAVVDGNVFRVLARYFGIVDPVDTNQGKKSIMEIASTLITGSDPGLHNQAIMEFGALQCVPVNPDCNKCPLHPECYAYINNQVDGLPVKKKRTKVRKRYFNYFVIFTDHSVFLKKRTENDIWKNLYEFPMIETGKKINIKKFLSDQQVQYVLENFEQVEIRNISSWQSHILSHQKIGYRFIVVHASLEKKITSHLIKVDKKDIFNFAVPKLLENFINNNTCF